VTRVRDPVAGGEAIKDHAHGIETPVNQPPFHSDITVWKFAPSKVLKQSSGTGHLENANVSTWAYP